MSLSDVTSKMRGDVYRTMREAIEHSEWNPNWLWDFRKFNMVAKPFLEALEKVHDKVVYAFDKTRGALFVYSRRGICLKVMERSPEGEDETEMDGVRLLDVHLGNASLIVVYNMEEDDVPFSAYEHVVNEVDGIYDCAPIDWKALKIGSYTAFDEKDFPDTVIAVGVEQKLANITL